MNKGIIIGIGIVIIISVVVLAVSNNSDETSISEEINETSISEEIKPKPKQFTVGLEESVGFSGG